MSRTCDTAASTKCRRMCEQAEYWEICTSGRVEKRQRKRNTHGTLFIPMQTFNWANESAWDTVDHGTTWSSVQWTTDYYGMITKLLDLMMQSLESKPFAICLGLRLTLCIRRMGIWISASLNLRPKCIYHNTIHRLYCNANDNVF